MIKKTYLKVTCFLSKKCYKSFCVFLQQVGVIDFDIFVMAFMMMMMMMMATMKENKDPLKNTPPLGPRFYTNPYHITSY